MEQTEYLRKIHNEILNVMDEVDRICKENGITYYLIGGSLLGAIRHKGFIPWDDDLDIVMPRKDFERFIKIAPSCLQSSFELQWTTTNPGYWIQFAKVCNTKTLFDERSYHDINKSFGIFVDIFVLDTTRGYSSTVAIRKNIIHKLMVMMRAKLGIVNGGEKIVKSKMLKVVTRPIPMRSLHLLMGKFMMMSNKSGGEYFTNFGSQYNAKRQTIAKEHYGTGRLAKFEDRQYRIPSNPEAVLTSIFGSDYMELPPVEKRRTHYPVRVIFSDGMAAEFDQDTPRIYAEADL